ncbi:MAG: prepilin-type N-terminal cleavage/methylation domain-containing protein [Desulfuromonadales bacterium]|nr:prepilin-type N-terminal cleavage/methylation domain-containing protein [Desulfuromonadales bacterium]
MMRISISGISSKAQAGFTLIELTIVVLLLGLFAGLTVPLLTGFGQDKLDASARRLAGTVKYLFNEAALAKTPHRIVFNLDEGNFQAKRLDHDEWVEVGGSGRLQKLPGEVRFRDITVPGRGLYTSGEVIIEILPVGWMEETVLHLQERNKERTLHIKPFTGTTEVFDGYREFEAQR